MSFASTNTIYRGDRCNRLTKVATHAIAKCHPHKQYVIYTTGNAKSRGNYRRHIRLRWPDGNWCSSGRSMGEWMGGWSSPHAVCRNLRFFSLTPCGGPLETREEEEPSIESLDPASVYNEQPLEHNLYSWTHNITAHT